MSKFSRILITTMAAFGLAVSTAPASAFAVQGLDADSVDTNSSNSAAADADANAETESAAAAESVNVAIAPTFDATDLSSGSLLRFGKNLIIAGVNETVDATTDGLLFSFGNRLDLRSASEYGIVAGNVVDYTATTAKDLFIAGSTVTLGADASIGRDVFGAASEFIVDTDLAGDLSVAAHLVILRDVTIAGNVNLSADTIAFGGTVTIAGTLSYNDTATVQGLDGVTAGTITTYTPETHELTAAELWYSKFLSMAGLFVTMLLIILLFPKLKDRIATATTAAQFGRNLLGGLGLLVFVPLVALVLLMTYFAAAAGIVTIVVYLIALYLATGFASAWLGHLIVNKVVHSQLPLILETLIGILIFGCLSMIPGVSLFSSAFALILGLGVFASCVRPGKVRPAAAAPVLVAAPENPFRGQKRGTKPTKAKETQPVAPKKAQSSAPKESQPAKTKESAKTTGSAKPKKSQESK